MIRAPLGTIWDGERACSLYNVDAEASGTCFQCTPALLHSMLTYERSSGSCNAMATTMTIMIQFAKLSPMSSHVYPESSVVRQPWRGFPEWRKSRGRE